MSRSNILARSCVCWTELGMSQIVGEIMKAFFLLDSHLGSKEDLKSRVNSSTKF